MAYPPTTPRQVASWIETKRTVVPQKKLTFPIAIVYSIQTPFGYVSLFIIFCQQLFKQEP